MTKLITSDLNAASSSVRNTTTVIESLNELESAISYFISSTTDSLTGPGYDAVRSKMGLYIDSINKQKKLFNNIINDSINANNRFNNYAYGYDEIDNSELEEFEVSFHNLERCKNWLESIDKITFNEIFPTLNYETYLDSVRNDYNLLKKYYLKIKDLDSEDGYCHSMLSNTETDVTSYNTAVLSINPVEFCGSNYDKVDFSKMTLESRTTLEHLMISWPDNMDKDRIKLIEEAFSLYGRGINYDMTNRNAVDENGMPKSMDCSSFISYICKNAGILQSLSCEKRNEDGFEEFSNHWTTNAYTIRSVPNENGENLEFITIQPDELLPGDFGLKYSQNNTYDTNHISMYLGTDDDGNYIIIDCSTKGKGIAIRTVNPNEYERLIRCNFGYGYESLETNNTDTDGEQLDGET